MAVRYLQKAQPRKQENLDETRALVTKILNDVKMRGEEAVRSYSEKFDKWNPRSLKLSGKQIEAAEGEVSGSAKKEISFLHDQVEKFALAQKKTLADFELEVSPGAVLGQKYIPLGSVGVYVPGGRYTLLASAMMSIVPAKVAGVGRIIACTPPKQGRLNPLVVYAIHLAGANEIWSIGGAQAIAAMAFGMDGSMTPVDMIAGPGNRFIAEAKRQVFGTVGIDLLAGPTEIGIIADETASPSLVAADLIAQAEHDFDSPQYVITTSEELARQLQDEIEKQLEGLSTAEVARSAWTRNGEIAVVDTKEEAAELSDRYAPEHLEVQSKDLDWYLAHLHNYGSLFLGEPTTVVYSDKAIGTNHILPTGKAARYTGGLWVGKYMKNVTYQRLDTRGSLWIAPHAAAISRLEGMEAHARSAEVRIKRYTT